MSIDKDLLSILVCPETKTPVSEADQKLIDSLNDKINKGELKNKAGHLIREQIDGGLVRADNKVVYPIRDNIPILLIEEAIDLSL